LLRQCAPNEKRREKKRRFLARFADGYLWKHLDNRLQMKDNNGDARKEAPMSGIQELLLLSGIRANP
jgi:hypothetical protein